MAVFVTPTLSEILSSIQADINSELIGADSTLTASVLNVLAIMLAGVAFNEYGFTTFVSNQVFPDTAESEYLRRWAAIWKVTPIAAIAAMGNVVVTGSNGVDIPIGTEFQRADGAVFASTADVSISGTTATVPVESEIAALAANTAPAAQMTFVSPINFVNTTAVVDSNGLTGGVDAESDASLLTRLLLRIQNPPQGGSAEDYVEWAFEVPNVTRAWVYPQELGIGTVTVRFMMDNEYENGIPESGDVATVQAHIDGLRPVTSTTTVVAPLPYLLDFTIHISPDTPTIRAAVQASLEEMLINDATPGGTIFLSRINEAVSIASGVFDQTTSFPSGNVVNDTGYISTMGTITWV